MTFLLGREGEILLNLGQSNRRKEEKALMGLMGLNKDRVTDNIKFPVLT